MKELLKKEIGSDGAAVSVVVDDKDLSVQVSYPLNKIVEPIAKLLDGAIDKLEQVIPGDQQAMAQGLKLEIREQLAKLLAQ